MRSITQLFSLTNYKHNDLSGGCYGRLPHEGDKSPSGKKNIWRKSSVLFFFQRRIFFQSTLIWLRSSVFSNIINFCTYAYFCVTGMKYIMYGFFQWRWSTYISVPHKHFVSSWPYTCSNGCNTIDSLCKNRIIFIFSKGVMWSRQRIWCHTNSKWSMIKNLNTFIERITLKRPSALSYHNRCTIYRPLFIKENIHLQTLYKLQLGLPEVLWQLY